MMFYGISRIQVNISQEEKERFNSFPIFGRLAYFYLFLALCDIITTQIVLELGGSELNPVMNINYPFNYMLKMLLSLFVAFSFRLFRMDKRFSWISYFICAIQLGVVINNIICIMKL